ncbi:MAG: DoxX family protein [Kofleriaceae bacterium]
MIKTVLRWILTVVMVLAGVNHFISPESYVAMMPDALPAHLALVYISGVAEIAGGLGLILPQTRKLAAWGLILLFIAVFPANLNMALNDLPLGGKPVPAWALWGRLPLQLVLIAWAYWFTRTPKPR